MIDWEAFAELEALVADLRKELKYTSDNKPNLNSHGTKTVTYQLRGRLEAIRVAVGRIESCLLTEYYTRQENDE